MWVAGGNIRSVEWMVLRVEFQADLFALFFVWSLALGCSVLFKQGTGSFCFFGSGHFVVGEPYYINMNLPCRKKKKKRNRKSSWTTHKVYAKKQNKKILSILQTYQNKE